MGLFESIGSAISGVVNTVTSKFSSLTGGSGSSGSKSTSTGTTPTGTTPSGSNYNTKSDQTPTVTNQQQETTEQILNNPNYSVSYKQSILRMETGNDSIGRYLGAEAGKAHYGSINTPATEAMVVKKAELIGRKYAAGIITSETTAKELGTLSRQYQYTTDSLTNIMQQGAAKELQNPTLTTPINQYQSYRVSYVPAGGLSAGAESARTVIVPGIALMKPSLLPSTKSFMTGEGSVYAPTMQEKEGKYTYVGAVELSQHGSTRLGWLYVSDKDLYFLAKPAKEIIGVGSLGQEVPMSGGEGAWGGMLESGKLTYETLLQLPEGAKISAISEAGTGKLIYEPAVKLTPSTKTTTEPAFGIMGLTLAAQGATGKTQEISAYSENKVLPTWEESKSIFSEEQQAIIERGLSLSGTAASISFKMQEQTQAQDASYYGLQNPYVAGTGIASIPVIGPAIISYNALEYSASKFFKNIGTAEQPEWAKAVTTALNLPTEDQSAYKAWMASSQEEKGVFGSFLYGYSEEVKSRPLGAISTAALTFSIGAAYEGTGLIGAKVATMSGLSKTRSLYKTGSALYKYGVPVVMASVYGASVITRAATPGESGAITFESVSQNIGQMMPEFVGIGIGAAVYSGVSQTIRQTSLSDIKTGISNLGTKLKSAPWEISGKIKESALVKYFEEKPQYIRQITATRNINIVESPLSPSGTAAEIESTFYTKYYERGYWEDPLQKLVNRATGLETEIKISKPAWVEPELVLTSEPTKIKALVDLPTYAKDLFFGDVSKSSFREMYATEVEKITIQQGESGIITANKLISGSVSEPMPFEFKTPELQRAANIAKTKKYTFQKSAIGQTPDVTMENIIEKGLSLELKDYKNIKVSGIGDIGEYVIGAEKISTKSVKGIEVTTNTKVTRLYEEESAYAKVTTKEMPSEAELEHYGKAGSEINKLLESRTVKGKFVKGMPQLQIQGPLERLAIARTLESDIGEFGKQPTYAPYYPAVKAVTPKESPWRTPLSETFGKKEPGFPAPATKQAAILKQPEVIVAKVSESSIASPELEARIYRNSAEELYQDVGVSIERVQGESTIQALLGFEYGNYGRLSSIAAPVSIVGSMQGVLALQDTMQSIMGAQKQSTVQSTIQNQLSRQITEIQSATKRVSLEDQISGLKNIQDISEDQSIKPVTESLINTVTTQIIKTTTITPQIPAPISTPIELTPPIKNITPPEPIVPIGTIISLPSLGENAGGGYGLRGKRTWVNVHPVGADIVKKSQGSMPDFRKFRMKKFPKF